VAALRLAEKGYRILVLEKGKRFEPTDFPKTNWNLRKWFWFPGFRWFGFFRISFFRHLTVLSGTGLGGGSLVYGRVLARPKEDFFFTGTWAGLADWKSELEPFYERASEMLGVVKNPRLCAGDVALGDLADRIGKAERFAATHVPVRYPPSSGFWRLLMAPMAQGPTFRKRFRMMAGELFRHPVRHLRMLFMPDITRHTTILLFMQHLESTLSFRKGFFGLKTLSNHHPRPSAFIPEAGNLAGRYAEIVDGTPMVLITESLLGNPTTAHLLGGAVMGENPSEGIIDKDNRVFGYKNMFICDGSMISANPGVNPSLTILAIAERAMSAISSPPILSNTSLQGSSAPRGGRATGSATG
jgi:choline dehydrogenase-like flavoprotein